MMEGKDGCVHMLLSRPLSYLRPNLIIYSFNNNLRESCPLGKTLEVERTFVIYNGGSTGTKLVF